MSFAALNLVLMNSTYSLRFCFTVFHIRILVSGVVVIAASFVLNVLEWVRSLILIIFLF